VQALLAVAADFFGGRRASFFLPMIRRGAHLVPRHRSLQTSQQLRR
jgi:hypothetical protein